jgi:hypothetical protein
MLICDWFLFYRDRENVGAILAMDLLDSATSVHRGTADSRNAASAPAIWRHLSSASRQIAAASAARPNMDLWARLTRRSSRVWAASQVATARSASNAQSARLHKCAATDRKDLDTVSAHRRTCCSHNARNANVASAIRQPVTSATFLATHLILRTGSTALASTFWGRETRRSSGRMVNAIASSIRTGRR